MGKGAPSAPAAPDPSATAKAQSAANLETAIAQGWLGAMNQNSPFGNVSYSQTGTQRVGDKDVPQFTQNVQLSPSDQRQLDLTNALQERALGAGQTVLGNVESSISNPFSLSGLPAAPGMGDFTADRDRVTQSIIERNQPQMTRSREGYENKLANQGIMQGSEAWKNAQDDLGRQENDFRLAAEQAGGAEQSRLFGLGTAARQNALQEAQLLRSQPINEYATLLGLGGNIQTPQFQSAPTPQLAGTDIMGPTNLQYQSQLAGWNANNAQRNATKGGLAGLGGSLGSAAIMSSDVRLKEDIKFVGYENGNKIYHYRYIKEIDPAQSLWRGVMAQDIMFSRPDAIHVDDKGYYMVNYALLGVDCGRVH